MSINEPTEAQIEAAIKAGREEYFSANASASTSLDRAIRAALLAAARLAPEPVGEGAEERGEQLTGKLLELHRRILDARKNHLFFVSGADFSEFEKVFLNAAIILNKASRSALAAPGQSAEPTRLGDFRHPDAKIAMSDRQATAIAMIDGSTRDEVEALRKPAVPPEPGDAVRAELVERLRERVETVHRLHGISINVDSNLLEGALAALTSPPPGAVTDDAPRRFAIEYDGFVGTKIGSYRRLDGKTGLVLQQDGTNVVHVYGDKWCKPAPPSTQPTGER